MKAKAAYKRLTYEDKFARHYYCNASRFVSKMKQANRRKLRHSKISDREMKYERE